MLWDHELLPHLSQSTMKANALLQVQQHVGFLPTPTEFAWFPPHTHTHTCIHTYTPNSNHFQPEAWDLGSPLYDAFVSPQSGPDDSSARCADVPLPTMMVITTVMSLPYPVTFSNFPLSTEIRSKTSKPGTEALHYFSSDLFSVLSFRPVWGVPMAPSLLNSCPTHWLWPPIKPSGTPRLIAEGCCL